MPSPSQRAWLGPILCWVLLLAPQLQSQESVAPKAGPSGASPAGSRQSTSDGEGQLQQTSQPLEEDPAVSLARWMTGLETLEATVTQRIYANETLLEESRGRFAMAPPRLLWQIYEPFPQTLLLDEEQLQIYDQDLGQLTIQSLSNASGPMPADLLMRPDRLANGDYTITRRVLNDEQIYRLTPNASSTLFQALDIALIGGVLTTFVIYDWQGQQTRLAFDNVSVNQPLPATQFQLVVPEGADVIRG